MFKRAQPPWNPPECKNQPVLKLYNSLTRQKEIFVPSNGKIVTWYSCGPTVYDASHMGHARSYITFDILRRVLSDYFGYEIFYVMNITDIDDKIIRRARQNYLFEKYTSETHTLETILTDSKDVMNKLMETIQATTDVDKKQMYEKLMEKLLLSIENLENAVKSDDSDQIEMAQKNFILDSKDPLSDWLDSKFGHTINDNAIFASLPQHWEQEFHKDMACLNILKPNILTRVSEYVPEIVAYIERIIENGVAYSINGSVYFDVAAFDKRAGNHYAKLVPEAYGDTSSLREGEGDLSTVDQMSEKRSPNDFALWKNSKPGEPAWESPWGRGRPGWHIECSAMASAIFGPTLDIHTGGVDLKFPHHDNEIAQSEAYFGSPEWVKYFLHSGHLTIAGCKMSKSLKNFVSIQDALSQYSARQLRFAFLLHSWRDTLDYGPNTMEIALQYEKLFNEFFLTVKDLSRNTAAKDVFRKFENVEIELNRKFLNCKEKVHSALCDNIDTRCALEALRELVTAGNLYLRDNKIANNVLLEDIALYITRILTIFGTIMEPLKIGFRINTANTEDFEECLMPYLQILSKFRDCIRSMARTSKLGNFLNECDKLRDEILPNVGVRIEDREDGPSAVKLIDREILLGEKVAKEQLKLEKEEQKKAFLGNVQMVKDVQRQIPPMEMFKRQTDRYSKFDENGLPTHHVDGREISKGQIKKLLKLQQTQERKYKEYLASKES